MGSRPARTCSSCRCAAYNQIAYVFDQEVVDPVLVQSGFIYIDQAGQDHYSLGAAVASFPGDGRQRVVVAQFEDGTNIPGFEDDVTDAVIAGARGRPRPSLRYRRAARTASGFTVTVPGTAGQTNDPDLVVHRARSAAVTAT